MYPETGERRCATIMFSDLSGYTAMNERLDPEEVEAIMHRIKTAAIRIVESRGGTVNQFVGDEVVALFGIPRAHEDDPCRAVHAALELHTFVRELNAEVEKDVGQTLGMHTGINSGLIVTSLRDQRDGKFGITGDVVNTGARLLAAANNDEILVSPVTQRLVAPYFQTEPVGLIHMKGKSEGMVPHRVVKKTAVQTRFEAAELKGFTPYAGREKELLALHSAFLKARAGQGRFVTIHGEAGVGKSRLVAEFLHRVQHQVLDFSILRGRCQSHEQHAAYLPFTELLRLAFGIDDIDSPTTMRQKVVDAVLALNAGRDEYLPALLRILSIPSDQYSVPNELSGEGLQRNIHAALSATLAALGRRQPLILLLEDWQWADEASDVALMHIVDTVRAASALLVVNYRADYLPAWHGTSDTEIELGPLDQSGTQSMIRAIYGADELPDMLTEDILQRSSGNPFFVEELCELLRDQGIVRVVDGRVTLQRGLKNVTIPETVQALIRAKLDRLDRASRAVLGPASVIGREFLVPILDRVLADREKLPSLLQNLSRNDLIQFLRSSPEQSCQFKHAITQEVTYDTILRKRRAALHQLVAEAIEELYAARLEEHLEVLAFHYDRSDASDRATRYLELAGDKATGRFALVDARAHYEHALRRVAAAEQTEAKRRKLVELTLKWGEISVYSAPPDVVIPVLETALGHAEDLGLDVESAQLSRLIGFLNIFGGNLSAAKRLYARCQTIGQRCNLKVLEAHGVSGLGFVANHAAKFRESVKHLETGYALHREAGELLGCAHAANLLNNSYAHLGEFESAREATERALVAARACDALTRQWLSHYWSGLTLILQGSWDSAILEASGALTYARGVDKMLIVSVAGSVVAQAQFMLGERHRGIAQLEEMAEIARQGTIYELYSRVFGPLALCCAEVGRNEESLRAAESCLQGCVRTCAGYEHWAYWAQAIVASNTGAKSEVVDTHFQQSIELAKARGQRPFLAQAHFYRSKVLLKRGDVTTASAALKQATELFERMDMAGWLAEARRQTLSV